MMRTSKSAVVLSWCRAAWSSTLGQFHEHGLPEVLAGMKSGDRVVSRLWFDHRDEPEATRLARVGVVASVKRSRFHLQDLHLVDLAVPREQFLDVLFLHIGRQPPDEQIRAWVPNLYVLCLPDYFK